jgi:hypothetical protein
MNADEAKAAQREARVQALAERLFVARTAGKTYGLDADIAVGGSVIPRNANALAIDPGYSRKSGGCACAWAYEGELRGAWFKRAADFRDGSGDHDPRYVIVEQPQQDSRSWGVPPAVLIKLAWEGASLAGLYAGASGAELHAPSVSDWKGGEKKPNHHRRLWAVLSEAERAVLGGAKTHAAIMAACEKGARCRWRLPSDQLYPSTFKTHNLLDAAALLMWALGRLDRVG